MTGSDYDTFHPWERQMSQIGPAESKVLTRLGNGTYDVGQVGMKNKYEILKSSASIKAKMGKEVHSCDAHLAVFTGDGNESSYKQFVKHVHDYHKNEKDESGANIGYLLTLSEDSRKSWI